MEPIKKLHPGQQAIISTLQAAVSDHERKQNYDEVLAAGQKLYDALQLALSLAPDAEIGILPGLQIVGAKEAWLKATGKQGEAA